MSQLLSLRGVPTSNSLGVIDERVLVVSDTHEALKAAVTGALPGCVAVCRLCRPWGSSYPPALDGVAARKANTVKLASTGGPSPSRRAGRPWICRSSTSMRGIARSID